MEFFRNFFDSTGFMPHGMCILWRKDLLTLHVASDAIIALAYFAIPAILLYFLHRRKDVIFSWVFVMFALFIVACGITHLFGIWTFWYPDYLEQGVAKAFTAIVSIMTALGLLKILPNLLELPSPKQLLDANQKLSMEVAVRQRVETELAEQAELLNSKAEELNALNEELSRINNVFIGREERMVELKNEVNQLARELGRSEVYETPASV